MKQLLFSLLLLTGLYLLFTGAGCQRGVGLALDRTSGWIDTTRQPSVRIEQVVLPPMKILSITYEAKSAAETGSLLNAGYIDLCTFVNLHRLHSDKVMAFYHTYEVPYIVEAGVEVDSIPPVLTGSIKARFLQGGEAIILHYKGPYERSSFAYHTLEKWLKDNGRQVNGLPFEVYLNDPVTIKDRYKLLTDIYQLLH